MTFLMSTQSGHKTKKRRSLSSQKKTKIPPNSRSLDDTNISTFLEIMELETN